MERTLIETSAPRQNVTLDAMRGIAAIAVMLYHIGAYTGIDVAGYAYQAVDLFFMISGYVLARAYEPRFTAGMSAAKFARRRIARLYPTLFIGVIVAVGVAMILHEPVSSLSVLMTFALIPDITGRNIFPLNSVLWSLFFEIIFNIFHALGFRYLSTSRLVTFVIISGIGFTAAIFCYRSLSVGWGSENFAAGFVRTAWGYGIGVLIYRLNFGGSKWRTSPAIPIMLISALLFVPKIGAGGPRVVLAVFVLMPIAILLAVRGLDLANGNKLGAWVGSISYPLYTIHLPVVILAAHCAGNKKSVLFWAIVVIVIISSAAAFDKFIDAPLRKSIRRD